MSVIANISRSLTCPACHKHLRWFGLESSRVRCPSCRTRFIALSKPSGECEAVPESDDAVGQMISDWVRPDWEADDEREALVVGTIACDERRVPSPECGSTTADRNKPAAGPRLCNGDSSNLPTRKAG